MKSIKIAYLAIIFLVLCAPVSQMVFHVLPKQLLNGVQKETARPELSLAGVFSSSFQDDFTKWFDQNFGMKGYLVKTNNQILYSLFREPGPSGEGIVFGKHEQLYGKPYIDCYLQVSQPFLIQRLDGEAARIKELQDLLAERGIFFTVFLTPGKASVYPEYIPDDFWVASNGQLNPNRCNFIAALRKHSVHHVDAISLLQRFKQSSNVPLFPRGGGHWTEMGAYLALEELLAQICKTSGRDIGKVELEDVQLTPPSGSDTELAVFMNTWIPPLDYSAPKVKVRPVPPDIKSKVLFVGGSFNWIVLEMLWSAGLPSSLDFLYYYHNKVSYPDPAPQLQQNIDRLDWESDIFNNDVIVLEINEMYVSDDFDSLGSGFARDALVRLKKLKLATKH